MLMKNSNDTIRNRSRDLPVCSAVPQPLRHQQRVPPPHTHMYTLNNMTCGKQCVGRSIWRQRCGRELELFVVHEVSVCRGIRLCKHSGLHCIQFKLDKNIEHTAVQEFLTEHNKPTLGLNCSNWLVKVKALWKYVLCIVEGGN
jgi:hypothetical protein